MSRECCGPDPVDSPDPVDLAIEPMPPLWRDRALALPAPAGFGRPDLSAFASHPNRP